MSQEAEQIRNKLKEKAKPEKVFFVKRILATPFEVLGVMVPDSREIAKQYNNLDVYEIYNLFDELIKSKIHEERSMAIHILQQYKKKFSLETWKFLRARMQYFQTWDIIDWLATDVFAEILKNNLELTGEIKEMAESKNFWERRLAIESTYRLIKQNKMDLTFLLAEKLIYDNNTYVQKAAGWMLREAGKRNRHAVKDFIMMHLDMKPIAFSYATEKMKELRGVRKAKQKPYFIIIRGPAGVGKTTIAKMLEERLKGIVIHIDRLLEKYGLDYVNLEAGCIEDKNLLKINREVIPEVKKRLKEGRKIIFDGNFYSKNQLEDLIKRLKTEGYIFTLKADIDECLKRDKTRKELGEKGIREVHALVSRFDSGIIMNVNNKSAEEVVKDILSVLPK